MNKLIPLVLTLCLFFSYPTQASKGIVTKGILDCGLWLDARRGNNAISLEHYLVGLINGLALGRGIEIWYAKGIEVNERQLHYWMDSYCARNPMRGVLEGAVEFTKERTGQW